MNSFSFVRFVPGIIWFFVVLLLTCLPGSDVPEVGWLANIQFDKLVHAGMFGVMVLLFVYPVFYRPEARQKNLRYTILITSLCIAWGLAIEFIQLYWVVGRDFDLWDWAADSFGSLLAFLICFRLINDVHRETWLSKISGLK